MTIREILEGLDAFGDKHDGNSRLDQAEAALIAYMEEREAEYDEIFSWLLGENGDFPLSEPGKRYNWRPELRRRLTELTKRRQG